MHGDKKSSTGIKGLDEITSGGFPTGRATLLAGNVGCGKTTFGMKFLVQGIAEGEPGIFVTLEETPKELVADMKSVGMDLAPLVERGLLSILRVDLRRVTMTEGGEYDIGSLFVQLADALAAMDAKRVVIDTVDTLFSGVRDAATLRLQLRGLFTWLKEKGLTVAATAEAGTGSITRRGFEEYVADCVIALDFRVTEEISTRRLRVVKYRGSVHPSDEFPFLIDDRGITLIPITSLRLDYEPTGLFVSTGVPQLDDMMQGKGYAQGSSILVSGTPGTGKTTLSFTFIDAACRRGERGVYFGFEESAAQTMHNMKSVGLDLAQWVEKGLLLVHNARVSMYGLERHLLSIHRVVEDFDPAAVVIDPMSILTDIGSVSQAKSMVTRLIDFLKMRHVTTMFTDLTHDESVAVSTKVEVSSIIDTWILLRDIEERRRRRRTLLILKSRGLAHSDSVRELVMSGDGISLSPLRDDEPHEEAYRDAGAGTRGLPTIRH